ncbi:MAG: hypothetical protein K2X78_15085 [Burkholderiaceae bacterium]|nr:hypothetical protein [Burkholderiaceae bacterium]
MDPLVQLASQTFKEASKSGLPWQDLILAMGVAAKMLARHASITAGGADAVAQAPDLLQRGFDQDLPPTRAIHRGRGSVAATLNGKPLQLWRIDPRDLPPGAR